MREPSGEVRRMWSRELEDALWQGVLAEAAQRIGADAEEPDEQEALRMVEERVLAGAPELPLAELCDLTDRLFGRLRGDLGSLSYLLRDREVTEIMVNGPQEVFVEKKGRLIRTRDRFTNVEELEQVIRRIASSVHREINELEPILDARLADGSRVNAVMKNVAIGGPALTIRRFSREKITLEHMVELGSVTREGADLLRKLVRAGMNVFVSGGTSSGKTTLLNALADHIPPEERVVVIEDSLELQLYDTENIVRLECRNANSLGRGRVTMNDLIRTSLRMRPDRVVVGEVRGAETADMLQALNTGHCGMSTGHANSSRGMLRRLEAMYLSGADIPIDAIRAQITEGIDILVHLMRDREGRRKVVEIQELLGFREGEYLLNPLFVMEDGRQLQATGNRLQNDRKLRLRGEA